MKKIVTVLVGAVLSLSAQSGKELFLQRCAPCHGEKGMQKALGISSLIGKMDKKTLVESLRIYRIGRLSRYGRGELMTEQAASLSDRDILKIADYLQSLRQKGK